MGYKEPGQKISRASGAAKQVSKLLEAAEVIDIILDEAHKDFAPELNREVGAVLARRLHSEYNFNVEKLRWYKPLNLHNVCAPVVGEYVLLIEAPASSFGIGKNQTDMYYLSSINLFGEVNANHNHFSSIIVGEEGVKTDFVGNIAGSDEDPQLGEYFSEAQVQKLNLFEGDHLLEGRFGHGIRLGSTAANGAPSHLWDGGNDETPIVIISNGHADGGGDYYTEDVNNDASTIMLTSQQQVGIIINNSMPPQVENPPSYQDSQVILCADRLLFSSKTDYVILNGGGGVAIITPEWKADFSAMMDIIKDLIADVEKLSQGTFPTGVGPTGPHPSVPGTISQVKSKWSQLEQ